MRTVKMTLLLLAALCLGVASVEAADVVSYTAYASPGSAPDGNNGAVDVWTVTGDGGAGRSYLQGNQDGNINVWTIWDLSDQPGGTYATHTFAGGALTVGQTVEIDYTHNRNIDNGKYIGVRLLNGTTTEVAMVFRGGKLVFSRYDTGSGQYVDINKYYDRYDFFRVVFRLTGANTYFMSVSEGSITDNTSGGGNGGDDGNAAVGDVVDFWTGTFTGAAITGIQVFTEGGNDSDQWFDNLTIHNNWLTSPHDPYPAMEEADVLVEDLELSWAVPVIRNPADPNYFIADPNLVSFNLYYKDTDANLLTVTPVSITEWNTETLRASYVPSPELIKNSTCTWRVDTVRNNGPVAAGEVWTFETELTKAIITSNPAYQVVDAGATAVFSVGIITESPEVYQWYKVVDGVNDTLLDDGGDISGTETDTLSIANAELADEGQYYCIVNNESGVPVPSKAAPLAIKRKIAYWPFENNLFGSTIVDSPATTVIGEPNFVGGILGNGVEFDDGIDMLYTDPEQVSYFDICDYTMTVACWVKTTDSQDWCPLVARNGEGEGWQLRQSGFTDDRPCFTTRGTGNDDGTPANRTIYDGNWHYVVGTFDGTIKKVYIDGVVSRVYSGDDGSLVKDGDDIEIPMNPSDSPIAIAGRVSGSFDEGLNIETGNIVAGIYDEVEIYNYALDAATIAQTYADLSGTNVCLTQKYDLDNDCVVDLNDLGLLASEWLNNEIVEPTL